MYGTKRILNISQYTAQALVALLIHFRPMMLLANQHVSLSSYSTVNTIAPQFHALVLGLGGGGLAMFLSQCLSAYIPSCQGSSADSVVTEVTSPPLILVEAVELDPTVVRLAKQWFGCDRIRTHQYAPLTCLSLVLHLIKPDSVNIFFCNKLLTDKYIVYIL